MPSKFEGIFLHRSLYQCMFSYLHRFVVRDENMEYGQEHHSLSFVSVEKLQQTETIDHYLMGTLITGSLQRFVKRLLAKKAANEIIDNRRYP